LILKNFLGSFCVFWGPPHGEAIPTSKDSAPRSISLPSPVFTDKSKIANLHTSVKSLLLILYQDKMGNWVREENSETEYFRPVLT